MIRARYIVAVVFVAALIAATSFTATEFAAAQNGGSDTQSQLQESAPSAPALGSQGQSGDDSTLEIAPQTSVTPPNAGSEVIPGGRSFRPGENTTSINPNYYPNTENGDSSTLNGSRPNPNPMLRHQKPYIGITVTETTKCYKGAEEHGLEVLKVDPNSPAWAAGVQAPSSASALGATGATLGDLIPIVGTVVESALSKHGDLGLSGDLIVAVDDNRVRTEQELDDEIAKLKPGDTMYLTVLRQLPGGGHATKKIAVHVGQYGQPVANADPAALPDPGANSLR